MAKKFPVPREIVAAYVAGEVPTAPLKTYILSAERSTRYTMFVTGFTATAQLLNPP